MKRTLILLFTVIVLIIPLASFASDCADIDASGAVNILDITYLINYLYKGGPEPNCGTSFFGTCGDVNGSGTVNILDITYLINYLYMGGPEPVFCETSTMVDIDGNVYKTVKIGDQWWMMENLKVTHYRNGDPIPNVTDAYEWTVLYYGAYCDYNNDTGNVAIYGRLYNWYTIADGRYIAPEGWHVASGADWQTLIDYLGGREVAGGKMKEADTTHWTSPNTGATNESGFTALPGGYRYTSDLYMGDQAHFWLPVELLYPFESFAYFYGLTYVNAEAYLPYIEKVTGCSIRCVKD